MGGQIPQNKRIWRDRLQVEVREGPNPFWSFHNDPGNLYDPDGRFLPVLIGIGLGAAALLSGGCSKPPIPDPDGCWKEGNKKNVGFPGPTKAGKPIGLVLQHEGCQVCCDEKYPITGGKPGDGDKFEACMKNCNEHLEAGR